MRKTLGLLAAMLLLMGSVAACAPVEDAVPSGDASQETGAGTPTGNTLQQEEAALPGTTQEAATNSPDEGTPDEAGDSTTNVTQGPNFRLLISDETNDIEDFSELWIAVSGIGLVSGDEEGVTDETFASVVNVNLRELTGDAAVETWVGYVESGDYVKVFLYVEDVWGVLVDPVEGEEPVIKLPSDKLQLKLPVRIDEAEEGEEQEIADFVFDITVHEAGNSGKYILSPQASESGQGKTYRLLEHTEERITKGKPDWTGKPEDKGKPDWAAQPGGKNSETGEEEA